MRGLNTPIHQLRKNVFIEVAKAAYLDDERQIREAVEEIPYKITPEEEPRYRESIHRERAICSERVRLAMGLSLRPQDRPVPVTSGLSKSTVDEIYYEPPLMQVIPSACNACEDNIYEVSNMCKGCISHPCMVVCPKEAISRVDGHAFIDRDKCIKCGRCKDACPYDAISKKIRPCSVACGVKAIRSDKYGRACIDPVKCVSCGMCMVSCPFGAIADKSQFFQLIRSMRGGAKVIAEVAPAYVGQFGKNVTPEKFRAALLKMGFAEVYEVALGADIGCVTEASDYVHNVKTGAAPYLLTSCCPSWAVLAKKTLPEETVSCVSHELTPMVATARSIKKSNENVKVVFIGPCAAKKLEAMRRTVRSDVDFVITFEELSAMLEAAGIDPANVEETERMHNATGAGRNYAIAGGVAASIEKCINEYYPGTEVKIAKVEGLAECQKMLLRTKAGQMDGYLIEGMACPGGCVAGAGTLIPINEANKEVVKIVTTSSRDIPPKELKEIELN